MNLTCCCTCFGSSQVQTTSPDVQPPNNPATDEDLYRDIGYPPPHSYFREEGVENVHPFSVQRPRGERVTDGAEGNEEQHYPVTESIQVEGAGTDLEEALNIRNGTNAHPGTILAFLRQLNREAEAASTEG